LRDCEIGYWDRILVEQICIRIIDSSGSISKHFSYHSIILTPHSNDFATKLIDYVIKKFPAHYGTRSLTIVCARVHSLQQ